jgi:hypothetical protein
MVTHGKTIAGFRHSAAENHELNKSPNSSNRIRIPGKTICTGSPLTPPNSSGKNALDAPPSALPGNHKPTHFLSHQSPQWDLSSSLPSPLPSLAPSWSCSSAQHKPADARLQVRNRLPPDLCRLVAWSNPFPIFSVGAKTFLFPQTLFALECPCTEERRLPGHRRRSWPSPRR